MPEISTYRRGEDVQLSPSFHLREFECRCGKCKKTLISSEHVLLLQALRDSIGLPITITSGYRCDRHNTACGGSRNSQHRRGTATDIVVTGVYADQIADRCEHFDGLGRYGSFTHVDSRGHRARWDARINGEVHDDK